MQLQLRQHPSLIKYMGSKTKLLQFLINGLNSCPIDGQLVDLFAGSASLSGAVGDGKSSVSGYIDSELYKLGWVEKQFKIVLDIDGIEHDTPTHKVDCVKGRVALDVEWNNKTEFYDRDLNNFRLLHNLKAISVGIIITRSSSLQASTFNPLGLGSKYGASTTHFNKLLPKIEGGGAGGCPLLVITIEDGAYIDNMVPILTAPKP